MFSVPGWNVSAQLATQVEAQKPADPAKEGKKSKKRKRAQQERDAALAVDAANVDQLWGQIVEGKGPAVAEASTEGASTAPAQDAAPEADAGAEKRSKKRSRKGDKKDAAVNDKPLPTNDDTVAHKEAPKPAAQSTTTDATESTVKRDKKKRKKDNKKNESSTSQPEAVAIVPVAPAAALIPEPPNLTPLQKSMRAKLTSARFRHLNESLYTKPSKESLSIFAENPEMFEDYHRGFAQQVEVWPENPVDSYVSTILERGQIRVKDPWKDKKRQDKKKKGGKNTNATELPDSTPTSTNGLKPLPRNMRGHATIADLGCGVASLSHRLQPSLKNLNLTIHSFDLSKPTGPTAPLVTVADISALPLPDSSVDVSIFCLALMGTNWLDFVDEAWRILRWRGELWVSEIKSRFGRPGGPGPGGRKVPINSVGSLRKSQKADGKKANKKKAEDDDVEEGPQDSDDEAELSFVVDGAETKASQGTDVSAFVSALQKRGFVLDALPERQSDAIDLSNKMFVKMQFVKAAQPTHGKNKDKAKEAGRDGRGAKDPRGAMKMGIKGKKFGIVAGGAEDEEDADDGKVLKPCLYKIR